MNQKKKNHFLGANFANFAGGLPEESPLGWMVITCSCSKPESAAAEGPDEVWIVYNWPPREIVWPLADFGRHNSLIPPPPPPVAPDVLGPCAKTAFKPPPPAPVPCAWAWAKNAWRLIAEESEPIFDCWDWEADFTVAPELVINVIGWSIRGGWGQFLCAWIHWRHWANSR